jgi:plastocyanin
MALGLVAIAMLASGMAAGNIAQAGGGCHAQPGGEGSGNAVSIENCSFEPAVLRVDPGTKVTFTNKEGLPHTVTGADWGEHDYLNIGDTLTLTFAKDGTYAYSCILHPGMVGAVVVGDGTGSPPASVTAASDGDDDGNRLGLWSLATVGALTGMVATGAVGVALGRRRS